MRATAEQDLWALAIGVVFAALVAWLTGKIGEWQERRWLAKGYKRCACPCGQYEHWEPPK